MVIWLYEYYNTEFIAFYFVKKSADEVISVMHISFQGFLFESVMSIK